MHSTSLGVMEPPHASHLSRKKFKHMQKTAMQQEQGDCMLNMMQSKFRVQLHQYCWDVCIA